MSSIYSTKSNKIVRFNQVNIPNEKDLEDFIEKNPQVLSDDLFIIGRQERTDKGKIVDLIGLDREGNVTIIEMKKIADSRQVLGQIMEYYRWAKGLNIDQLNEIAKHNQHLNRFPHLYKKYEVEFEKIPQRFNQKQTLYIVASQVDKEIQEICKDLNSEHGKQFKCVELNMYENNDQRIVKVDTVVGDDGGSDNPPSDSWYSMSNISYDNGKGHPTQIKFPDESVLNIRSWVDILFQVATWLIQEEYITKSDCPIPTGAKRYLIHTKPIHPSNKTFVAPKKIHKVYLECNDNRMKCVQHAEKLITVAGLEPDDFKFM